MLTARHVQRIKSSADAAAFASGGGTKASPPPLLLLLLILLLIQLLLLLPGHEGELQPPPANPCCWCRTIEPPCGAASLLALA